MTVNFFFVVVGCFHDYKYNKTKNIQLFLIHKTCYFKPIIRVISFSVNLSENALDKINPITFI